MREIYIRKNISILYIRKHGKLEKYSLNLPIEPLHNIYNHPQSFGIFPLLTSRFDFSLCLWLLCVCVYVSV